MNNQQGQQPPSQPPYGQPNQQPPQYPSQWQQQPFYPPPYQPPEKPRSSFKLGLGIGCGIMAAFAIGIVVLAILVSAGRQSSTTQQQPSAQPTQALQWTTVQTITGNGSKKTAIFTAPGDWKIVWSCIGQNIDGVTADGLLAVNVYNADGSIADPVAVYATCKAGQTKTTGETEEHQGGQVYLSVNGTGDWTIQIQELK